MTLDAVNPKSLGEAKGYSNGVIAPASARILFVAGQVGWDEHHKFPGSSDPEQEMLLQFSQALRNVVEVVKAAGGAPDAIARMNVYVTDKKLYQARTREIGQSWREIVGRWFPAMTLVEVKSLLEEKALVELEATAALPAAGGGL